jgi:hypothetical protein
MCQLKNKGQLELELLKRDHSDAFVGSDNEEDQKDKKESKTEFI